MFEIGEIVVYRQEVYQIIKKITDLSTSEDYFMLEPYHKEEGIITQVKIPCNRKSYLRKLSTKEEIQSLINKIPHIKAIEGTAREIEAEYRNRLKKPSLEDLIVIIKTSWTRNHQRMAQHKKIGYTDERYFVQANEYLIAEIAAVMSISKQEAQTYLEQAIDKDKDR